MIWLLLILTTLMAGVYLLAHVTLVPLSARKEVSLGQFVQLQDGETHFQWHGPETGPIIVCIHGLSTPSYAFAPLIPLLIDQGYRVLSYDLYGRGGSDRVEGEQTREYFMRQLRELLASQGITDRVTLLGYSMGGALATARAVEAPETVNRLILLAPTGLGVELGRFYDFAAKLPYLGDWMMEVIGPLLSYWQYGRTTSDIPFEEDINAWIREDLRVEGALEAILSSQRNFLSEDMAEDHMLIAKTGIPMLVMWGEQDRVIPIEALTALRKINPKARHVIFDWADHRLPYLWPEDVAAAIEDNL